MNVRIRMFYGCAYHRVAFTGTRTRNLAPAGSSVVVGSGSAQPDISLTGNGLGSPYATSYAICLRFCDVRTCS